MTAEKDLHIGQESTLIAAVLIVGLIGLLGLGLVLAGFAGMEHTLGPEAMFKAFLGFVILYAAWRMWVFLRWPTFSVTARRLTTRNLLGTRHIPFAAVTRMAVHVEQLPRNHGAGRMAKPPKVARLLVQTQDQRINRITLPRFPGGNGAILQALAARSGITPQELASPEDVAAWRGAQ